MLRDKQEAKFRGVMSTQNTHHILVFGRVFSSFHLVIIAFTVIYLILGFLCISGEKGCIWKLCEDWKEFGGELSLNVATFQRRDVEFV